MIKKSFCAFTNKFSHKLESTRAMGHVSTLQGLIRRAYYLGTWERDDPQPTILLSMDGPERHSADESLAAQLLDQKLMSNLK